MQSQYSIPTDVGSGTVLEIFPPSGESTTFAIEDDSSVFIGAGPSCGIRLEGPEVEDLHCMLLYSKRKLHVRDWHTGRTLINGDAIVDEVELGPGDELQVGEYRLRVQGSHTESQASQDEVLPIQEQYEQEAGFEPLAMEPAAAVDVPSELPSASFEMMDAFAFDPDAEEELGSFGNESGGENADDITRLELEQLRMDLAQRDADIAALKSNAEMEVETVDDETTVRLVSRLEELLEELQSSDQRVLALEELLRASDAANQAEQEERLQLESWVSEIEQRVSQREAESNAEAERLNRLLEERRSQLERAESQVQRLMETQSGSEGLADNSLVAEMRAQNQELESRLQKLAAESGELQQQLEGSDDLCEAREQIATLEQKMLQMEVETSRERAELAREKAELRRTQDEMERQMRDQSDMSDSETRLVAMRQHLRERYENEKQEREEQRQRGLGGRISRLLKSVSG